MSDPAAVHRQLKIKSGAVTRLAKETKLYRKETTDLVTRKAKLITDAADEWDIKNATKMVQESEKMVIETKARLDKAMEDLRALITSAKDDGLPAEDAEVLKAEQTVQEATA